MGKFVPFDGLADAIITEVADAMYVMGDTLRTEAHISITAGSVSGKNHVPSRPGEPPNNDTGELVRGLEVQQIAPLTVRVTSNAGHSVPLEFGTSRMAARPFLAPARDKSRVEVQKIAAKAVNHALRKFARR